MAIHLCGLPGGEGRAAHLLLDLAPCMLSWADSPSSARQTDAGASVRWSMSSRSHAARCVYVSDAEAPSLVIDVCRCVQFRVQTPWSPERVQNLLEHHECDAHAGARCVDALLDRHQRQPGIIDGNQELEDRLQ